MADQNPNLPTMSRRAVAADVAAGVTAQPYVQPTGPVEAAPGQQMGVTVSGQGGAGAVRPTANVADFSNVIPAAIARAFQPRIEEAQQAQFLKGAMQAQAGKSAAQVADDEPWTANLFGPSHAQQGAAFYNAQTALADMESDFQKSMPQLEQMDSATVQQHISDKIQGMLTGNTPTDLLIQKGAIERTRTMMTTWQNAATAYQQRTAVVAQGNAAASAADALQQAAVQSAKAGGKAANSNPEGRIAAARASFAQILQKPAIQTDKSYQNFLLGFTRSVLAKGQWYAYKAIQDTGVLQALPLENQTALDTYADRQMTQTRNKVSVQYALPIAALAAGAQTGQLSPIEVAKQATSFNHLFSAETGLDDGYYDTKAIAGLAGSAGRSLFEARNQQIEHAYRLQEQASDRDAKLQEKQYAEQLKVRALTAAAVDGHLGNVQVPAGDQQTTLTNIMAAAAATDKDPVQGVINKGLPVFIQNYQNSGVVSDAYKTNLAHQVALAGGQPYGQAAQQLYEQWHTIYGQPGGPAMADAYFGHEVSQRLLGYQNSMHAQADPTIAWASAWAAPVRPPFAHLTSDQKQSAQDAINRVIGVASPDAGGIIGHLFRDANNSLLPTQRGQLSGVMAGAFTDFKQRDPSLTDAAAAQAALKSVQAQGWNLGGKYLVKDQPGRPPLNVQAGVPNTVEFNDTLSDTITHALHKRGFGDDSDNQFYAMTAQRDGRTEVLVYATNTDGKSAQVVIPLDDVRKRYEDSVRSARKSLTNDPASANPGAMPLTQ